MSPRGKIRIRSSAPGIKITIREKTHYVCRNCGNQYHSFHPFCPQCLGETAAPQPRSRSLRIVSLNKDLMENICHVLTVLSANPDFDFPRALKSLPWTMIRDTDEAVLRYWKETLDANGVQSLIGPNPQKKRVSRSPLYTANAPLPFYFSTVLRDGIREVATSISNPALLLKWADVVRSAFSLMERFYKGKPAERVLFSDFLFEIDHQLLDCITGYRSRYRDNEQWFTKRVEKIRALLEGMETEILAVRDQVEEQL